MSTKPPAPAASSVRSRPVDPDRPSYDRVTGGADRWWYLGAVVAGAVLLVVTALRQPFSYDEITQITPYGSWDVTEVLGATRQPPLDPLLGSVLTHVFGQGQLQQRLVPVLSGIAVLTLMSLLLRRLGLRGAGAWAVWVMATTPLMVRYGAYTRPYALPMAEMLLLGYALHRFLDGGGRRWLTVVWVSAVLLPLTRVPEPTVFLGVTAASLAWASWRGRLRWALARPPAVACLVGLFVVGVPMFVLLGAETSGSFFDPSPGGVVARAGRGFHEIGTAVVPLLGSSFPWWPLTLSVVVLAVAVTVSRRRLLGWPLWWPFLAAPVAFLLAYHLVNPFSFFSLPYRSRAAFFFVPAFVLVTAALASVVTDRSRVALRWRAPLAVLLAAAFVTQLPATARVVSYDAAPDFGAASRVLTSRLPDDAIVLYDRPSPAGQSRQPFLGSPRYMGRRPYVVNVFELAQEASSVPRSGPVYVLVNGQCTRPGRCTVVRRPWVRHVPGWRLLRTQERFSFYAPDQRQSGMPGVISAMHAFGEALGPELGYVETLTEAALLDRQGDHDRARRLVSRLGSRLSATDRERVDQWARNQGLRVP